MKKAMLEKVDRLMLDYGKIRKAFLASSVASKDLLPVVVQDAISQEVLLLAYTDFTAFEYSLRNNVVAFWSTSRNELWIKGLSSGCTLQLREVRVNCEQNSLLYLVERAENIGACHVRNDEGDYNKSCFYRRLNTQTGKLEIIKKGELK